MTWVLLPSIAARLVFLLSHRRPNQTSSHIVIRWRWMSFDDLMGCANERHFNALRRKRRPIMNGTLAAVDQIEI